ncbi:MAG: MauE/DoxX family redox-associated membrane protein [Humidesulfovibrio sp.]|nr:MauE/DoxX family redox-associated membrane protein [Humidesulfovibrio sp.]
MQGLREQVGLVPWDGVEWMLRLVLAGIFLYASADKIIHPHDFAVIVKAYHLLPEPLANLTALWLPWLELTIGVCLFTGFLCDGALALATGLLAVFWIALFIDYFRGIDVACGCFSSSPEETAPMLWYIGRDALLLGLALFTVEARRRAGNALQLHS